MASRILFLLLLAANIGVAAWIVLAPPDTTPAMPMADAGVAPLMLLSEREDAAGSANAAELSSAPETLAQARDDRCLSIGAFPTQSDMRRALNTLTPHVKRIQFHETRAQQTRGFQVFLPAPSTREQALDVARQLYAKGVRDYYVVTAGDQQNTISLGLFKDRGNAQRRQAEISALGFGAAIAERTETLPAYWIDFALPRESTLRWQDRLPDLLQIAEREIPCF
jgi:hypothetical protein